MYTETKYRWDDGKKNAFRLELQNNLDKLNAVMSNIDMNSKDSINLAVRNVTTFIRNEADPVFLVEISQS